MICSKGRKGAQDRSRCDGWWSAPLGGVSRSESHGGL